MREREQLLEIIILSLGFTTAIGAHSISEEVAGFLLYGFPEENYLCLLSLMFIAVHVILSDNILRSSCLNDKNITSAKWYIKLPQHSFVDFNSLENMFLTHF